MSHVGNRSTRTRQLVEYRNYGKQNNKMNRAHGNKAKQKYSRIGKVGRKGQHYAIHRTTCANKTHKIQARKEIDEVRKHPCQPPCDKVKQQKFPAAHLLLYLRAKHKQSKHIEKNMTNVSVHKHITKKGPHIAAIHQ